MKCQTNSSLITGLKITKYKLFLPGFCSVAYKKAFAKSSGTGEKIVGTFVNFWGHMKDAKKVYRISILKIFVISMNVIF